jgi:hypothetical protein
MGWKEDMNVDLTNPNFEVLHRTNIVKAKIKTQPNTIEFINISVLNIVETIDPIIVIKIRIIIEIKDTSIECFIFRFIPFIELIHCCEIAPLIIELIPNTPKPKAPPNRIFSINVRFAIEPIKNITTPAIKLIKTILNIKFRVLGNVLIYLDNPATLLILDIVNLINVKLFGVVRL